jgi:hypothetical protein
MTNSAPFPRLPDNWEATRATLHAYARALGAVPRQHAPAHPQWWHASLKLDDSGLRTDDIALPDGRTLIGRMRFDEHTITLDVADSSAAFDMRAGLTGTEMADAVIAAAAALGLGDGYDRSRFESDESREYNADHAMTFWQVLEAVGSVLHGRHASLDGPLSPVQVWPHGFDLSFDWFGTKVERYEEDGEMTEHPAQLNLGFYPAGDAYFYSNPWPFDATLVDSPLPHGAEWHTEGWQGSMLPYAALASDPAGPAKLAEYAAAVHAAASPTLSA